MPEIKKAKKSDSLEGTLSTNHYASSIDNMVRNDTPFEGSANAMPSMGPVSGSISSQKIKKTK